MATLTFPADLGGSGRVEGIQSILYATIHNAATGAATSANGSALTQMVTLNYDLWRGFMTFDTSVLTANAVISSAFVRLVASGGAFDNNDSTTLDIVASTQASSTAISTADYNKTGTVTFGSKAFSAWTNTSNANNDFTLNASGLANINKTGFTKIGIVTELDRGNVAPTLRNQITWDNTQSLLSVTYTIVPPAGFLLMF